MIAVMFSKKSGDLYPGKFSTILFCEITHEILNPFPREEFFFTTDEPR